MTVTDIASLVGGVVKGNAELEIHSGNTIEMATEDQIAFVLSDKAEKIKESMAGCLLVEENMHAEEGRTIIQVKQPRNAFAKVLQTLHPVEHPPQGVHASAVVAESAILDKGVAVAPAAVIGNHVRIGENSTIGPHVVIGSGCTVGAGCCISAGVVLYAGVRLGDRVILHAGCVVGADGFGYVFEEDHHEKFPQVGTVEIGDDVELGANVCIDRGALGATTIGDGTKLDNMVHIGHNCQIGCHVLIAAQTGLSGGCVIEDYVVMGGQVGMGEQAHVGAGAHIGGQSGVLPHRRIPPGQTVWGTPSRPHREYLKKQALVERLPKIIAELREIETRLDHELDEKREK
ncbi:MAG: UDP-3-O-(3-hydroxymyristoyl)glucosamine N-acyltransferase [Solibacterales bacterium]|nr:UDP-3-O-(3-hydroxymyristoyl)glucosamine N-acyltransferase [Bryobacterales bacterium]|tara:strand:- start:17430 stop:18464 length:1035 start_codon:yes stop_codon:yes gene_type:complete